MSDDLELIEFQCPDCPDQVTNPFNIAEAVKTINEMMFGNPKPVCPTCGGSRKVLVKRENLIKLSARK